MSPQPYLARRGAYRSEADPTSRESERPGAFSISVDGDPHRTAGRGRVYFQFQPQLSGRSGNPHRRERNARVHFQFAPMLYGRGRTHIVSEIRTHAPIQFQRMRPPAITQQAMNATAARNAATNMATRLMLPPTVCTHISTEIQAPAPLQFG